MMQNTINLISLLNEGKIIQIKPQGYSMYPMFVPGRDSAIIKKANTNMLKRGDVVLYRREGSILVLHRICKRCENEIYLVGDNQVKIEGPVRIEQVEGILIAFIHKGKKISVRNPFYQLLSHMWLIARPYRQGMKQFAVKIKKYLQ
ncbi:MAG: S24/S26 family peptidase [Velocimicrobium sp.]